MKLEAIMGSRGATKAQRRHTKQERLEARIPAAQKRILEHAASLRGTSLSYFVIASAQEAATKTIKDFEMLSLCDEAREVFVRALLNPPAPNKAMGTAVDRYRRVLRSN
jgi:uncharacterized protein (DUF1778 family)